MSRQSIGQRATKRGSAKAKSREQKAASNAIAAVKERRPPTAAEQQAITAAQRAQEKRPQPIAVAVTETSYIPHSDLTGWRAQLRETFGTGSQDFALKQLIYVADAVGAKPGEKPTEGRINSALAAISGIGPKDEIEAMLAVQMASTHAAAMTLLSRIYHAEQIPQLDANGNMAIKLLRTFAVQTEVLAKLRRGGEQTVRVEHVHVHAGGQAVVGNVNTPLGQTGGGGQVQNNEQPYETKEQGARALAFAPGSPVWSANAPRDRVQGEGGER